MRNAPFIIGSGVSGLLLIVANVASYFSERSTYYRFLEQSGWVWAGSWSWGFPFSMVMAGLGRDNHSELAPLGLALIIVIWVIVCGFAGMCFELVAQRLSNNNE